MPIISCCLLLGVPMVAEEVSCSVTPNGVSFFFFFFFYDFFKVFSLLSSSHRLHRLSNTLTTRDFIRVVMLTAFVITLANYHICQFAALLPLVTSLAIMHCDVLEPQPGVTTVKNPSVPGSGCSGPVSSGSFRFPP